MFQKNMECAQLSIKEEAEDEKNMGVMVCTLIQVSLRKLLAR
jgi:hypothetical protein